MVVKLLPFIIVPFLIVALIGFWGIFSPKKATDKTVLDNFLPVSSEPVEVPKSLPEASNEDKIKTLQEAVDKLVSEINSLKSSNSSIDTRIDAVEASDIDLKARVSALENATPAPVSSSKSTVYIPLGSGGGPWANSDWYSTPEYQVSLDPANYPGYTGMNLEVTFRMVESAGTASVRLYNSTDSQATSSQVDTTSTSFSVYTTSSFKLASGNKNYILQLKSTEGKNIFIQNARIRVNF
ncbi:hypothetical protein HYS92_01610 [Candidatus Daviesbacteria bacterium]|nr:hypothetical protein [Candidatus Daviesbacteria bacterium]